VSSLWTPHGERPVGRPEPGEAGAGPGASPGADSEATGEHAGDGQAIDELRQRLLATPAAVVVANHAYGLFELAALHLSAQPPRLEDARLAVDALGGLLDAVVDRLGDAAEPLRDALAQIRLAYVQIHAALQEQPAAGSSPPGTASPGG